MLVMSSDWHEVWCLATAVTCAIDESSDVVLFGEQLPDWLVARDLLARSVLYKISSQQLLLSTSIVVSLLVCYQRWPLFTQSHSGRCMPLNTASLRIEGTLRLSERINLRLATFRQQQQ